MRLRQLDLPPEVSDDTLKAFLRFYQLETWMREMVYLELKAFYGLDWWDKAENALKRARVPVKLTDRYVAKDKRHSHIATPENDPLWFISLDSLLKIVFDQKLWKLFGSYFTTKRLFRMRLEEILPTRNRVAHCRALHPSDVDRLQQFLRDFDSGFWNFCTSYGDRYAFSKHLARNYVHSHFNATESQDQDIDISYSVRPSVYGRRPRVQLGAGFVYDVTLGTSHSSRYLDYERILKLTRPIHKFALHIMLDSSQHSLRVTFPSTLTSQTIIEAIERFAHVVHNTYSVVPLRAWVAENESGKKDHWQEFEKDNRPFEQIASSWPHFVIAPSHPYTFLNGECPCTFFG